MDARATLAEELDNEIARLKFELEKTITPEDEWLLRSFFYTGAACALNTLAFDFTTINQSILRGCEDINNGHAKLKS